MAARKKTTNTQASLETVDFRHTGETRTNIPPAKIAGEGKVPRIPKANYHYSPHLPPVLRFDPTGAPDKLPELLVEAQKRPLRPEEAKQLAEALRTQEPWLEWATKREQHEKGLFEVDPVALHIHERVSAQAIVRIAMREDVQRDLFADPQQPYQQAVQFYKHDMDWANRLILGDSLQVMSSLARRENLAGKVQMIYMDPPYGIRFASNFQPEVGRRDVSDHESDMSREPETVRAYRDTWSLGAHSYLTYLRDRMRLARELLAESGSMFVQISEENLHHVRELMDDLFGPQNFVVLICYRRLGTMVGRTIQSSAHYLVWYARNRAVMKYHKVFLPQVAGVGTGDHYTQLQSPNGSVRAMTADERAGAQLDTNTEAFQLVSLATGGYRPNTTIDYSFRGSTYHPGANKCWRTTREGLGRLETADRISLAGKTIRYKQLLNDFPLTEVTTIWDDTARDVENLYVVQTPTNIVRRCLLMTTDPGDLVLDPTCGSGTTAFVAEDWGRRWITIDTSRVAVSLARSRVLTSRYESFRLKSPNTGVRGGFVNVVVPHLTLKSIAQCDELDIVKGKHEPGLDAHLGRCNVALAGSVTPEIRRRLQLKLSDKERMTGKRSVLEADRRRWELPKHRFEHWNVPFDVDASDWPKELQEAIAAYRRAWQAKMADVNACLAANAEQEELVDQPEVVKGVVRVSGPFTVEGVRPEELSLGEGGVFDPTPNEFEPEDSPALENLNAYLTRMVQLIRQDGVTFLGNNHRRFARVEALFAQSTGTLLHAEGVWADADSEMPTVAIAFGPQYGPVTALQVEEVIRSAKRYDELVVAGFSFDAEATATIQELQPPKLRIHQAFIRPDVNPAMDGLLKDTANSQLFTVFGQPDVGVRKTKTGEYEVELKGVDIYDPIQNTVRSSGAEKVAGWFLDGDFDGRCFCITQAFFPDKSAWEKIAKALKGSANEEAFERFSGTVSLPFPAGKHKRIAVKVIDPRGNEVMAIHPLPA